MIRPAIKCPTFWALKETTDPMIQMIDATTNAYRRPMISERYPAANAPTNEPADIEAVIYRC